MRVQLRPPLNPSIMVSRGSSEASIGSPLCRKVIFSSLRGCKKCPHLGSIDCREIPFSLDRLIYVRKNLNFHSSPSKWYTRIFIFDIVNYLYERFKIFSRDGTHCTSYSFSLCSLVVLLVMLAYVHFDESFRTYSLFTYFYTPARRALCYGNGYLFLYRIALKCFLSVFWV